MVIYWYPFAPIVLHPPRLTRRVLERLQHRPVVVLTGSRQSGKITLVRQLLPAAGGPDAVYSTLDDPDERLRLAADPVRRLDRGRHLVVLDEIQKQPDLLDAVKLLADQGRRFLLLGSSQILLPRQVRETLAGRASLLELWPLGLSERVEEAAETPPCTLDTIWQEGEAALLRLEASPALAQNLLAARTAQLFNASEVGRELGVAVNTVRRYLRFLEIPYQAHLLRAAAPTATARLVKSPKLYWTDPALAALLAGKPGIVDGPLYETAVLDELLRWSS